MKRYFEIAGVRHEGKDGPYVLYKDAVALETYSEMLEQENAKLKAENRELQVSCDDFIEQCSKLKAQVENTRLGLNRLNKLISYGDQLRPYANGIQLIESGSVDVCKDSYDTITAPTLADLIDLVALMGEKDDHA